MQLNTTMTMLYLQSSTTSQCNLFGQVMDKLFIHAHSIILNWRSTVISAGFIPCGSENKLQITSVETATNVLSVASRL
jgi:hypothetical protein